MEMPRDAKERAHNPHTLLTVNGLTVCLFAALLFVLVPPGICAANRHALVIGNGDYMDLGVLRNPTNDAQAMTDALQLVGFEVETLLDGDITAMEEAVVRLGRRLSDSPDSIGFFFFAGHGVQSEGANYLIPARARIPSEIFLRSRALGAQEVLDVLQRASNHLNIVVLDACRDNPFGWSRSLTRGLVALRSPPPGSVVVYATSAGGVSHDGLGKNGVFTTELLRMLQIPGLDVAELFRRTGEAVQTKTEGSQIPAIYSQFFGRVVLNEDEAISLISKRGLSIPMVWVEGGRFVMGAMDGDLDEQPVHPVTVKSFSMGTYPITQEQWEEIMKNYPSRQWGPRMPVTNIYWYDALALCNALSRKDGLEEVYTIVGDDVQCHWDRIGYRLPTEAEWEYAAKGGMLSQGYRFAGSDDRDTVAWHEGNSGGELHDVGLKLPNELGLHDLSGNVWEMCWDWYSPHYYEGGEMIDPRGPDDCTSRVVRGGGYGTMGVTSTYRRGYWVKTRSSDIGFRVVLPADQ